jgi:hypothetical protein
MRKSQFHDIERHHSYIVEIGGEDESYFYEAEIHLNLGFWVIHEREISTGTIWVYPDRTVYSPK